MYDIIMNIIGYTYDAETYTPLDSAVVAVSGAIVIIIFFWLLDAITHFIISFGKKGR